MSDSEESDSFGYLVEHTAHDELDESDEEANGEGSSSDSDVDAHRNGLFDLEAADSDDDRSSVDGNGVGHDESDSWDDDHYFPQFKRLPFELRHQIWEWFCPDLTAKSRVYWFHALWTRRRSGRYDMVVGEGPLLEQQTRPARAMLAVHQESRQLALKAFPDTLSFDNHGILRFNAARDVVFLDSTETMMLVLEALPTIPGFSEHIRNLALEPPVLTDLESRASDVFGGFENLKTVYYSIYPNEHKPQQVQWCTSDKVNRYSVATFEEQPGLGEDGQHLFCWPDVENHRHFADAEVPLDALADDMRADAIHLKGASFGGAPIWPIALFLWDSHHRFDKLLEWDGEQELDGWSSDEEDDGEPDEYESEGIDDSDISDHSLQSDPNDDLVVLDDDESERAGETSDDGSSAASGSSRPGNQAGAIDLTGDDGEQIAEFSSPEQSSATLRGSDESAEESDLPVPRTARLKRSRARVVEPDSEDDSDDALPRKRARTDRRQNPIILSSDDEEDERRKMRANRRARAVMLEDEDDEEGEEDNETNNHANKSQDGGTDWSGISTSDAERVDSEEEASKPLSLAEKLQLHRQRNPIPDSDDEDSDIEEMGDDDYDARNYADFQDDEEGNEVSGEGEDAEEQDLILQDEDEVEDDYEY
ncbi:hypothetical protein NEMBOFW57_009223 [Staphylotrichum longicolle]|uniref:2EXR domain-containing protein n=1 Tax=Staphylotrichum longicolle TaxID=669026 RepID=A0AAD4ESP3_9PEZI|nr:hypothetical protein NEMBOFW57_009223 [Staphylotrichum longicolle]